MSRGIRLQVLGQPAPVKERADAVRNRLKILSAARDLLQNRSIKEICMDELAKTAGVGKGTLYRRFEDRAALCRALLNDDAVELQNAAINGFGAPMAPPWLDHIAHLLDALFDFALAHTDMLSEVRALERGAAQFDHPAHRWQRDTLAIYLQKAIDNGECPQLATELSAEFMLLPLDTDMLTYHLGRGMPRELMKAEFMRHWRSGLTFPS